MKSRGAAGRGNTFGGSPSKKPGIFSRAAASAKSGLGKAGRGLGKAGKGLGAGLGRAKAGLGKASRSAVTFAGKGAKSFGQGAKSFGQGAKKGAGMISSKIKSGAGSVRDFGKGTMHGMKAGGQAKKGHVKGSALGRGQSLGKAARTGYRGVKSKGGAAIAKGKELGAKGIAGVKKHGPVLAKKGMRQMGRSAAGLKTAGGMVAAGVKKHGPVLAKKGMRQAGRAAGALGRGGKAIGGALGRAGGYVKGKLGSLGARGAGKAAGGGGGGGGAGGSANNKQSNVMKTGNVTTNVNIPGGVGAGGGAAAPQPERVLSRKEQLYNAKTKGLVQRKQEHHAGGGYLGKLKRGIARTGQAGMAAGGNTGANA